MEALHCKTNFSGHYPTTTNNNHLSGKFCDVLPELNKIIIIIIIIILIIMIIIMLIVVIIIIIIIIVIFDLVFVSNVT